MTDRELMQQALEALDAYSWEQVQSATAALRQRLAQPETVMAEYKFQTYAAYKTPDGEMKIGVVPTSRREWVGLTDEDMVMCESEEDVRFVRAIEAKIKEKNA